MRRMTFGFQFPLHLACKLDEIRPSLGRVYFADGYAYVTDAQILIRISLKDLWNGDGDIALLDGKTISKDGFKTLFATKERPSIAEDGILLGEVLYKTRAEVKPPLGYEEVLKSTLNDAPAPTNRIRMAYERVASLGKILDPDDRGLLFVFRGESRAVVVKPYDSSVDAIALLMPMYVDNERY